MEAKRSKGVKDKTEMFLWVRPNIKNFVRREAKKREVSMSKYVEDLIKEVKKK